MDTNGGFIYTAAAQASSNASSVSAVVDTSPNKLSEAQLTRLTSWLDTSLLELTRNQRRRHEPASPLYTLGAYLDEALKILGVLASMSCIAPQGGIKVAYLLRLTAELAEGCAGYDVDRYSDTAESDTNAEEEKPKYTTRALSHSLRLFHLVDVQWSALLQSQSLDWPSAKVEATRLFPLTAEPKLDAVPGTDGGGRHLPSSTPQETASAQPSHRTLSQTDRVRLRNVSLRTRATLRDWAHAQLDAAWSADAYAERALELHESDLAVRACEAGEERIEEGDLENSRGEMDGIVEEFDEQDEQEEVILSGKVERSQRQARAVAQVVPPLTEEEEEEDMEQIVGPSHDAQQPAAVLDEEARPQREEVDDTEEGKHFADLFNKHLDPDASDASGSEDCATPSIATHKRRASASSSSRPTKSSRPTAPPPPQEGSPAPSADNMAEEGILIWDSAFAHVLSQTLMSLSDVADAQAEREARERRKRVGGGI